MRSWRQFAPDRRAGQCPPSRRGDRGPRSHLPGTEQARSARRPAFNPVTPEHVAFFKALLAGEFHPNGFRNKDLQGKLYSDPSDNPTETKRRTHRTSRLIAKLRGHRLIAKVKNSPLYRVTHNGVKAMWAAVRSRCIDFPAAFNRSESFAQ